MMRDQKRQVSLWHRRGSASGRTRVRSLSSAVRTSVSISAHPWLIALVAVLLLWVHSWFQTFACSFAALWLALLEKLHRFCTVSAPKSMISKIMSLQTSHLQMVGAILVQFLIFWPGKAAKAPP